MGSDLISRKAIMNRIESEYSQWGGDYDAEQILGDIEDFPAAYDIDKVLGELETLLEKEIALICRHVSDASYMAAIIEHTMLVDAIETVKARGININKADKCIKDNKKEVTK